MIRNFIIFVSLMPAFLFLFGCVDAKDSGDVGINENASTYETAEIYDDLRSQVFSRFGHSVKDQDVSAEGVFAVLMETGYPDSVVTLMVAYDGAVSMYYSNGGGNVGLGSHPGPRKASDNFLESVPAYQNYTERTQDYPLPKPGRVRFYFLTTDGDFTVEQNENILGNNQHELSPLFHQAHEVIAEILKVEITD